MNEKLPVTDSSSLKKLFQNDKNSNSPYIYIPIDSKNGLATPEKLSKLISGYKKSGYGGVIPFSRDNYAIDPLSEEYYDVYRMINQETQNNALSLAYLDDTYIMREYLKKLENPSRSVCKILCKYEYECTEGQVIKKKLHSDGTRMSLLAVNDDDFKIIDIRRYVKDDILEWDVPDGNWNIEEYICEPDITANYIDLMDYDISIEYLKRTLGVLIHELSPAQSTDNSKSPMDIFIYRNVVYAGQNRRMWHPNFNKVFIETYGFDPAPYYSLMFREFPGHSKRYKSMLMACRSKILTEGYLKAVSDYCNSHSMFCTGFPAEGKASLSSWIFGDGQMFHRFSSAPGISLPFAYLYGLNGIKVASSAADLIGAETVTADLFNYFQMLTKDIIYREAMNAFNRGVNMIFAHLGEDRNRENTDIVENESTTWGSIFSKGDDLADFASFVTRAQTMLGGGEHIAEAAIVYPINTLHSLSYLYQSSNTGFEYPYNPDNIDYMDVMNNFLGYVGIDSIFLHPDIIANRSFVEDGVLYITNDKKTTLKFKLVVLPSMTIIDVKTAQMLKKFFVEGGKIIATGHLPVISNVCSTIFDDVNVALNTESDEDREVRETIEFIFGSDVTDNTVYKRYYKNSNNKGGMAYFFPPNKTSVTRAETVSANLVYQATEKLGIAPDVYIDKMPRRELLGVVNYNLPDFLKIGVDKRLAKGSSMNYIHKKYAGCDIFYFTNTSGDTYTGNILLRGRHTLEEWNPYNGKTRRLTASLVKFRGEIYTAVELSIEASSCTFVVSADPRSNKDVLREIETDEMIPEFYPRVNF